MRCNSTWAAIILSEGFTQCNGAKLLAGDIAENFNRFRNLRIAGIDFVHVRERTHFGRSVATSSWYGRIAVCR